MTNLAESVHSYIVRCYLSNGHTRELRDDEDLLMILDSLQILRMLIDLEAEHAIKVENSELTPENLGTVERLAAFIAKKRQAAA